MVVGTCVENGAEMDDLFNNILDTVVFKSDTGPSKVDVGNGFGMKGDDGVVFIIGWGNLNDGGKWGVKEDGVDNRRLIKSLMKAGL